MITRDLLRQRLQERVAQERQAFANFNAALGARRELEQLLLLLPEDSPQEEVKEQNNG